jgi:hypothetical protein
LKDIVNIISSGLWSGTKDKPWRENFQVLVSEYLREIADEASGPTSTGCELGPRDKILAVLTGPAHRSHYTRHAASEQPRVAVKGSGPLAEFVHTSYAVESHGKSARIACGAQYQAAADLRAGVALSREYASNQVGGAAVLEARGKGDSADPEHLYGNGALTQRRAKLAAKSSPTQFGEAIEGAKLARRLIIAAGDATWQTLVCAYRGLQANLVDVSGLESLLTFRSTWLALAERTSSFGKTTVLVGTGARCARTCFGGVSHRRRSCHGPYVSRRFRRG